MLYASLQAGLGHLCCFLATSLHLRDRHPAQHPYPASLSLSSIPIQHPYPALAWTDADTEQADSVRARLVFCNTGYFVWKFFS
jgi:hypothetical protein